MFRLCFREGYRFQAFLNFAPVYLLLFSNLYLSVRLMYNWQQRFHLGPKTSHFNSILEIQKWKIPKHFGNHENIIPEINFYVDESYLICGNFVHVQWLLFFQQLYLIRDSRLRLFNSNCPCNGQN